MWVERNACPDKKEKKVKEKQMRKEEVGSVCDRQRKGKRMVWRRGKCHLRWRNALSGRTQGGERG